MKKKLTGQTVSTIKPPATGRLEIWDRQLPSFGLRITSAGAKSYVAVIRRPGSKHPVRIKVGEPGKMSLSDARKAARALMADPSALEAPQQAARDTVAQVAALYIERHQKKRNRAWQEVERILSRELAPIADKPISDVPRRDLRELINAKFDVAPFMANRLLAHVRHFFGWCVQEDILESSPVAGLKPPARETSRDRVLTNDELARVWHAAGALGWPFCPIVRLLMATGARRDEIGSMRWRDIDTEAATLTLPETKSGKPHTIALSPMALEIIATLPRIGDSPLVFPAARANSSNPVSGFSKAKARLDALSGVDGWRIHDIRRTVATGLQRLGVRLEVTESVLGHTSGSRSGIVGIYQRHEYRDEARAALNKWSRELERIIGRTESNVVAIM